MKKEYIDQNIYGVIQSAEEALSGYIAEIEDHEIIIKDGGKWKVDGQLVHFKEVDIIPNTLKMCLPSTFHVMPTHIAKLKYPHEGRPEIIMTNDDYNINFLFTKKDMPVTSPEKLEDIKKDYCKIMGRLNRSLKKIEEGFIEAGELEIPFFSVSIAAIDTDIYNLIFFLPLNRQLLIGSFNCTDYDEKEWKPVAKAIIRTILLEDHSYDNQHP